MLSCGLILQDYSFQFNGKDYLKTHGTAMGKNKGWYSFCQHIAKIRNVILRQSNPKPIFWKRFIDDTIRDKIEDFLVKANKFHTMIKFTAEVSETETTFLDTKVYKVDIFNKESILDVRTLFKPQQTYGDLQAFNS